MEEEVCCLWHQRASSTQIVGRLKDENKRLKSLVADLSSDKQILKGVLSNNLEAPPAFVNASRNRRHATKSVSVELAAWLALLAQVIDASPRRMSRPPYKSN